MVVKDVIGRSRHVVFRIEAAATPSRRDMINALRAVAAHRLGPERAEAAKVFLTAFDGARGAVRVIHREREAFEAALRDMTWVGRKDNPCTVRTLAVSGTLRGAKRCLAKDAAASVDR